MRKKQTQKGKKVEVARIRDWRKNKDRGKTRKRERREGERKRERRKGERKVG